MEYSLIKSERSLIHHPFSTNFLFVDMLCGGGKAEKTIQQVRRWQQHAERRMDKPPIRDPLNMRKKILFRPQRIIVVDVTF